MFKKIVVGVVVFFLSFGSLFSYEQYRNNGKVTYYKNYIEDRIGTKIHKKSLESRMDLLLKVEKLLGIYENKNISNKKKISIVSMLIAFQELIEESIILEPGNDAEDLVIEEPKRREEAGDFIDMEIISDIKEVSYTLGNIGAEITWLEYSDIECPFCARLHNSGTLERLQKKYGSDMNYVFQNFPLSFHKYAQTSAETLECVGEIKGEKIYYKTLSSLYKLQETERLSLEGIYEVTDNIGVDREKLDACLDESRHTDKIEKQLQQGQKLFNVTGTPSSIIINNATGEYKIIPGAYPYETFETAIEDLLH